MNYAQSSRDEKDSSISNLVGLRSNDDNVSCLMSVMMIDNK